MKTLILLIACLGISLKSQAKPKPFVSLNTENTFVFNGEVSQGTVANAILQLSNPKIKYMVINSPGGSIRAGIILGDFLDTRQDVICVAKKAQSMAFYLLQRCGRRVSMETVSLLQHQPSNFQLVEGPVSVQLSTLNAHLIRLDKEFYGRQAKRIGISKEKFEQLIYDDWVILSGSQAKELNVIDEVITVLCSDAMLKAQPPTCPYLL